MQQPTSSVSDTTQQPSSATTLTTIHDSLDIHYDPLLFDSDWRWWLHGDAFALSKPVSEPSHNFSATSKLFLAAFISFLLLILGFHAFLLESPMGNNRLPKSQTQLSQIVQ
ncbi:MAG: hypothetical protein AB4041_09585 [Microcystaceae cyanobacterium]